MNPLEELLDQAKRNKKKGIYVISTEFVIRKLKEHRKSDATQNDEDGSYSDSVV